ncbi:hypothetical protein BHM03_00036645 [Ensete ventricosum]|nr:hypothetical protein BHM03_00036645 [Ensete ventricosum]
MSSQVMHLDMKTQGLQLMRSQAVHLGNKTRGPLLSRANLLLSHEPSVKPAPTPPTTPSQECRCHFKRTAPPHVMRDEEIIVVANMISNHLRNIILYICVRNETGDTIRSHYSCVLDSNTISLITPEMYRRSISQ